MDKIRGGSSPPIRTKILHVKISNSTCPDFQKFANIDIYRMKGLRLFFTACLGFLVFQGAFADDADDIARAATRRTASTTVASNRQQSAQQPQTTTTRTGASGTVSRATNIQPTTNDTTTATRSGTTARSGNVVARDVSARSTTSSSQTVSPRSATNVTSRAAVSQHSVVASPDRTAARSAATVSRAATSARTALPATASRAGATVSRTATTGRGTTGHISNASRAATSRSTLTTSGRVARAGITAEEIMNRDYTQCREVYYSCMDEFCANKDSQLKRCACSSRIAEFDEMKQQLAEIEDKLLDFNQRLLTVNMDKEDAEALFTATEGELAFQQDDKSDSKKLLDEISEKLNTTFDDTTFGENLAPVSLSLNIDAAFDTVDSMMGASTTALSGTELYSAALPVCREMALEVCTQDELDIVESGYQMAIEQDCNTVAKAYQTQQDQARNKIREGSALLDMSRLDIYQQRNSDDILTCKKKMLDMLASTTVCGTDLQKCLDISGHYIDPSTGEAILTANLVNLGSLIVRPTGDEKWTDAPGNQRFVSFLNSKKQYLESATENCQDISDYVWDSFMEDALAQIKLAQESKLEEVRQSCTTLTTQCLTDTAKSLEDFDARALSIFGVQADKTVKQMCAEVQNACTALLTPVGDTGTGDTDTGDWGSGMTDIALDKTYETILTTCREIGRNCIIQSCKSISGNFGLCEDINTSVNRKSIINRDACWDEVYKCVADAGDDTISQITAKLKESGDITDGNFYKMLYGDNITNSNSMTKAPTDDKNYVYDWCTSECGNADSAKCYTCRITEKLWGNCEAKPDALLMDGRDELGQIDSDQAAHNKIKIVDDTTNETLLSWFAKNTKTEDVRDSCRDTSCGPGYILYNGQCIPANSFTSGDTQYCPVPKYWQFYVFDGFNNCCKTPDGAMGARDALGNCCMQTPVPEIKNLHYDTNKAYFVEAGIDPIAAITTRIGATTQNSASAGTPKTNGGLCLPKPITFVAALSTSEFLLCLGDITYTDTDDAFPSGKTVECSGEYVIVDKTNNIYKRPTGGTIQSISMYYNRNPSGDPNAAIITCEAITFSDNHWSSDPDKCPVPEGTKIRSWIVSH